MSDVPAVCPLWVARNPLQLLSADVADDDVAIVVRVRCHYQLLQPTEWTAEKDCCRFSVYSISFL